jgi:hypothetical protein
MAFDGITTGQSYFTVKRADWPLTATRYSIPFDTLPIRVAPLDKQIRVAVAGEEWTFNAQDDDDEPTSNYFTFADETAVTGGLACVGIRLVCSSVGGGVTEPAIAEIRAWDNTNTLLDLSGADFSGDEAGGNFFFENAFDSDISTRWEPPDSTDEEFIISFPEKVAISKVGWSAPGIPSPGAASFVADMTISLNVGTVDDPEWIEIGSETGLTSGDYPAMSDPFDAETMLLTIEVPASLQGGTLPPAIVLSSAPELNSDRVLVWRETRQDRPWIIPTGSARGLTYDVYWFFQQSLFILQELCEIDNVASYFSLGIAQQEKNDYTGGSQSQLHAGGGTTLSFSEVELLTGVPGAPADILSRDQITVERGDQSDGSSTTWTTLAYDPTPADEDEYSVDASAKTITFGSANTNDIRIRRVTRKDQLWVDFRSDYPNWNTPYLGLIQKQIRMLIEESCYLPTFYDGSVLNNSIFPRAWNWLVFSEGGSSFTPGGAAWGGDGSVIVWDNGVLLDPDEDYVIEFPNIEIPGGSDGGVSVGSGGGGWGGINIGGGDEDDPIENPVPTPGQEGSDPPPWPGFTIPTSIGVSVAWSSKDIDDLAAGDWEGAAVTIAGSNTSGDEFLDHCLRLEMEVTRDDVDDGLGGTYDLGHTEVWYFNKLFPDEVRPRAVAAALDEDGDGSFEETDSGSTTGGFVTGAALSTNLLNRVLELFQDGLSQPPQLRLLAGVLGLDDNFIQGNIENVPFFTAWQELTDLSIDADAAGVVSGTGFTWEQFQEYLDPDEDFSDFDIPVP